MKRINTLDFGGQHDDHLHYILLEYRQKLLRVLLILCIVINTILMILALIDWMRDPFVEWGIYNLISGATVFALLLFLYQANQKGFTSLAGWLFGLSVLSTIPTTYSLSSLNETFLFMALPIALSSFIIRPRASFFFACFVIAGYSLLFLQSPGVFVYDPYSLIALGLLAVGSYLVSSVLNKAISDAVRAYDETILGWAKALEMRDSETMGHSQRIVELTLRLAGKLGIKGIDLFHIRRGALLHDIGKMGIPDAILHKPGALSSEEWVIMRKHPEYAREYLDRVSYLTSALDIPYSHHERWDGTGYPQGLMEEEIPFAARVFAVVDVWDALTSQRPYRQAWSREKALEYIQQQAGRQFDPRIVAAFMDLIENQLQITKGTNTAGGAQLVAGSKNI